MLSWARLSAMQWRCPLTGATHSCSVLGPIHLRLPRARRSSVQLSDGVQLIIYARRIYDQAALASKVAGAESGPEFLTPWGNTFYELEVGALSCYGPTRRSPAPWPVHAGAPF